MCGRWVPNSRHTCVGDNREGGGCPARGSFLCMPNKGHHCSQTKYFISRCIDSFAYTYIHNLLLYMLDANNITIVLVQTFSRCIAYSNAVIKLFNVNCNYGNILFIYMNFREGNQAPGVGCECYRTLHGVRFACFKLNFISKYISKTEIYNFDICQRL